jgi:hypothetical protein
VVEIETHMHMHTWYLRSLLPKWPASTEIRSTSEDKVAQKLKVEDEGIARRCISNKIVHSSQLHLLILPM